MSEFSYLAAETAAHQVRERIERKQRSHVPGRPRRSGRRALASTLHGLANRLEG